MTDQNKQEKFLQVVKQLLAQKYNITTTQLGELELGTSTEGLRVTYHLVNQGQVLGKPVVTVSSDEGFKNIRVFNAIVRGDDVNQNDNLVAIWGFAPPNAFFGKPVLK